MDVTPFVGVWIETVTLVNCHRANVSHTLRGCVDWNLYDDGTTAGMDESHPSWVCGLKLNIHYHDEMDECHTLRGCVDWNLFAGITDELVVSHTLRGCVDWNDPDEEASKWIGESHPSWVCGLKLFEPSLRWQGQGHTLRGCVDWNSHYTIVGRTTSGHTLRGCVDWNLPIISPIT